MKSIFLMPMVLLAGNSFCQNNEPKLTEVWEPEPRIVSPGKSNADAPSDAIVLFDGTTQLKEWENEKGLPAQWILKEGVMTVAKGKGAIQTKQSFGDCQLHIEWRSPAVVKGEGQGRGNSGIFLMGIYELQVLDSYKNRTYSNGQAGSIYKQTPPLVNATRQPGEWQTYDIVFTAPRFNKDGFVKTPARITVFNNGVLIQNNTTVWGATQYIGIPKNKIHDEKAPLVLQDHGDEVSFKNIWIREL